MRLRNLRKLDCVGKPAQRSTFPHPALGRNLVRDATRHPACWIMLRAGLAVAIALPRSSAPPATRVSDHRQCSDVSDGFGTKLDDQPGTKVDPLGRMGGDRNRAAVSKLSASPSWLHHGIDPIANDRDQHRYPTTALVLSWTKLAGRSRFIELLAAEGAARAARLLQVSGAFGTPLLHGWNQLQGTSGSSSTA